MENQYFANNMVIYIGKKS